MKVGFIQASKIYNIKEPAGSFIWSGRRGSNSQHPAWKAGTLPIELLPQYALVLLYLFNYKHKIFAIFL